jgi:hypothetical protein
MASRYDGRGDAPTITRRRHVLACARCRARRVKCDRAQPACSNCIKVGALCQPVQQTGSSGASATSRPGSREPVERTSSSPFQRGRQQIPLARTVIFTTSNRERNRFFICKFRKAGGWKDSRVSESLLMGGRCRRGGCRL